MSYPRKSDTTEIVLEFEDGTSRRVVLKDDSSILLKLRKWGHLGDFNKLEVGGKRILSKHTVKNTGAPQYAAFKVIGRRHVPPKDHPSLLSHLIHTKFDVNKFIFHGGKQAAVYYEYSG